jgi:hypothetical protein
MKLVCDRYPSHSRIWNYIGMSVTFHDVVPWQRQRQCKSRHVVCGGRPFHAPPLSSAGAKMLVLEVVESLRYPLSE